MPDRFLSELPGLLTLLGVGLAIAWCALVLFTAWRLIHPPRKTFAAAVSRGLATDPGGLDPAREFDAWHLRTPDGLDLPVWDMPGDDPSGPTVVMCHGWGDSRIGALVRAPHWLGHAARVVCWDMRGHGEAPGTSALGTREVADLLALIDRLGDASRVVLVGWSLGAGVCIEAGARRADRIAGVFAEAPYALPMTPARNVLRESLLPFRTNLRPAMLLVGALLGRAPSWLRPGSDTSPGFDRARHARALKMPLIVLHGTDDSVCPLEDGRSIADAAPHGSIREVAGGSHNNLWTDASHANEAGSAITAFVASIG